MTNENHIFRMILELNNENLSELSKSDLSNFTYFTQNDRLFILSDNPFKLVNLFTEVKSKCNEIKLIHLDTLFKETPSQVSVKEYIKDSIYEDYCITKRKNKASFKCLPLNSSTNIIDYKNLSTILNTYSILSGAFPAPLPPVSINCSMNNFSSPVISAPYIT